MPPPLSHFHAYQRRAQFSCVTYRAFCQGARIHFSGSGNANYNITSQQCLHRRLTQLLQGISITMPMNIAVFMVRFFEGASADEKQVSKCVSYIHQSRLRPRLESWLLARTSTFITITCQHCMPTVSPIINAQQHDFTRHETCKANSIHLIAHLD